MPRKLRIFICLRRWRYGWIESRLSVTTGRICRYRRLALEKYLNSNIDKSSVVLQNAQACGFPESSTPRLLKRPQLARQWC